MIERTRLKQPGRGRPRTGYLAVVEALDYRVLAGVLAMELGQTVETRGRRAQQAGQKWAARITEADVPDRRARHGPRTTRIVDGAALRAVQVFRRMGFAPELAEPAETESNNRREKTIRLRACPVRELALAHPEVGCGVHLGLLQGLLATRLWHAVVDAPHSRRSRPTWNPSSNPTCAWPS